MGDALVVAGLVMLVGAALTVAIVLAGWDGPRAERGRHVGS